MPTDRTPAVDNLGNPLPIRPMLPARHRNIKEMDDLLDDVIEGHNALIVHDTGNLADIATLQGDMSTAQGDISDLDSDKAEKHGVVGSVQLYCHANFLAGETITIGADTYEANGAGANINFTIGLNLAASLSSLVVAINSSGTENVLAAVELFAADHLCLYNAATPGGVKAPGVGTAPAVSDTIADAATLWTGPAIGLGGNDYHQYMQIIDFAVTAESLLQMPYFNTGWSILHGFMYMCYDGATGLPKTTTATVTCPYAGIIAIDPAAGLTPLIATDRVKVIVW